MWVSGPAAADPSQRDDAALVRQASPHLFVIASAFASGSLWAAGVVVGVLSQLGRDDVDFEWRPSVSLTAALTSITAIGSVALLVSVIRARPIGNLGRWVLLVAFGVITALWCLSSVYAISRLAAGETSRRLINSSDWPVVGVCAAGVLLTVVMAQRALRHAALTRRQAGAVALLAVVAIGAMTVIAWRGRSDAEQVASPKTFVGPLDVGRLDESPPPSLIDAYLARLDAVGLPRPNRELFAIGVEHGSLICKTLSVEATVVIDSMETDPRAEVPDRLAEVATYCPAGYDAFESALKADSRYASLPYDTYKKALRG